MKFAYLMLTVSLIALGDKPVANAGGHIDQAVQENIDAQNAKLTELSDRAERLDHLYRAARFIPEHLSGGAGAPTTVRFGAKGQIYFNNNERHLSQCMVNPNAVPPPMTTDFFSYGTPFIYLPTDYVDKELASLQFKVDELDRFEEVENQLRVGLSGDKGRRKVVEILWNPGLARDLSYSQAYSSTRNHSCEKSLRDGGLRSLMDECIFKDFFEGFHSNVERVRKEHELRVKGMPEIVNEWAKIRTEFSEFRELLYKLECHY